MKSFRSFLARPLNGLLLLALLIGVASFLGWQNARSAPVRRHLEAGAQFLQQRQIGAAEREWREAVRLDPSNAEAWEQLGDLYQTAAKWRPAQDAFQHLLKLRPDTQGLLGQLATCALKLGDKSGADRYAQDALKRNPDDVAALRVALKIEQSKGNRDQWLSYLKHLVELQPHDLPSMVDLTIELYQRADYDKARLLTERMLKEDPDFAPAYYLRGLTFFAGNPTPTQLRQAVTDFKKTIELNPREIEAHRYLARVYMDLGRPAEAITQFEALGIGRPYASAHWLELSNAYRQVGQMEKAEDLRRRFVSLDRHNRLIMDVQNRLAKNHNSFEDHLQMGRLLLQSASSSEDAYQLYAHRYGQGQLIDVDFYARKAVRLRPKDAQAKSLLHQVEQVRLKYKQIGQEASAHKDFRKAERYLRRAVLLGANDAQAVEALEQAFDRTKLAVAP